MPEYHDIHRINNIGGRPGNADVLRRLSETLWRESGIPNLGHAVGDAAKAASSPWGRAVHMGANTEQYLPSKVTNYFSSSNPIRNSIGKHIAEGFGWEYDYEGGKLGKSQGFLGSKTWYGNASLGSKLFRGGTAVAAILYTGSYAKDGWDESGFSGAAGGVAQGIAEGYVGRKAFHGVLGSRAVSSGVSAYSAVSGATFRGLVPNATVVNKLFSRGGFLGARAASAVAGGVAFTGAASAGAVVGALMNPWALAAGAAYYGYQQLSEGIDRANRGNTRLRQVAALEMGAPILDQYGSIATLRQRSLAALQNSHVNGRMALGNEAALLH